jgi:hypothetical protein
MSKNKNFSRDFKLEAVWLIAKKGHDIATR